MGATATSRFPSQPDQRIEPPVHKVILDAIKIVDESLDHYDLVMPIALLVKNEIEKKQFELEDFCEKVKMGDNGIDKMKNFLRGRDCAEEFLHPISTVCEFTHPKARNHPILAMIYLAKENFYIDDPVKMAERLNESMDEVKPVLDP